jgi:hypothetical protein
MRAALAALFLCGSLLGACSDDDDPAPRAATGELPSDAEVVETPEGDHVYVSESQGMVYGACEVIEPHEDDISGWLDIRPPQGSSDFGFACDASYDPDED